MSRLENLLELKKKLINNPLTKENIEYFKKNNIEYHDLSEIEQLLQKELSSLKKQISFNVPVVISYTEMTSGEAVTAFLDANVLLFCVSPKTLNIYKNNIWLNNNDASFSSKKIISIRFSNNRIWYTKAYNNSVFFVDDIAQYKFGKKIVNISNDFFD